MIELEICPKCSEKHEWFTFYIEKNVRLQKVKNQQIAWCKTFHEFISKENYETKKIPILEIMNN